MIVFLGAILGGGYGAWLAHKRGGKRADIAQYAAGYGIAGAIVCLFALILFLRLG